MAKDKSKDDHLVLQFPSRQPIVAGFDDSGIPSTILGVCYGVRCIFRGKVTGTQLFTTEEKANNAAAILNEKSQEQKATKYEYKFDVQQFPIY